MNDFPYQSHGDSAHPPPSVFCVMLSVGVHGVYGLQFIATTLEQAEKFAAWQRDGIFGGTWHRLSTKRHWVYVQGLMMQRITEEPLDHRRGDDQADPAGLGDEVKALIAQYEGDLS